jgi:hypothetical protein
MARQSDQVISLVDETDSVVAVTRTGPEGEYHVASVPAGRYRVEAEPDPEWASAVSAAFSVDTEAVKLDLSALLPARDAAEEGALPAGEGTPATKAADAYWVLLGGVALPIFHGRKDRRSAAQAVRHWAY